jgi:hypothetical protein
LPRESRIDGRTFGKNNNAATLLLATRGVNDLMGHKMSFPDEKLQNYAQRIAPDVNKLGEKEQQDIASSQSQLRARERGKQSHSSLNLHTLSTSKQESSKENGTKRHPIGYGW